jgi:hypothetical protein
VRATFQRQNLSSAIWVSVKGRADDLEHGCLHRLYAREAASFQRQHSIRDNCVLNSVTGTVDMSVEIDFVRVMDKNLPVNPYSALCIRPVEQRSATAPDRRQSTEDDQSGSPTVRPVSKTVLHPEYPALGSRSPETARCLLGSLTPFVLDTSLLVQFPQLGTLQWYLDRQPVS